MHIDNIDEFQEVSTWSIPSFEGVAYPRTIKEAEALILPVETNVWGSQRDLQGIL